jgi:cobalt-zinc-cadmium efflux system membrane fusion protein
MTDITTHKTGDGQDVPVPVLDRRKQIRLVGVIVLGVLVLFLGVPLVSRLLFPPPAEAPPAVDDGTFAATQKQWETLRFETVHRQSLQDIITTDGKIAVDDDRTTPVFSPFTGRVTRIFVAAGDAVKPGSPLFAVIANEAAQSDADLLATAAQLKAAEAAEARQHDLLQHDGAALKDWEQAKVDLAVAQGAAAAAHARRSALGASIAHGEAIVRAPVGGIVTQRLIGAGQNIASAAGGSATQAFTISDFSKVWVVGNLREEDADKAYLGQSAQVRLLVAPDQPITAQLSYVAPMLDPASRRLVVRAVLDNRDGQLKPEMAITVSLLAEGGQAMLTVPESAVIYEGSTARVWVARARDHHLGVRPVVAGATVDGRVEIRDGLKDGEAVVTAGSLFIDRGAKAD